MRFSGLIAGILLLAPAIAIAQPVAVQISINTTQEKRYINPLIYGINAYVYDTEWGAGPWKTGLDNHESGLNITSRRLGGNTMTSYNWENGFSNSGNDDNHSNNSFQTFITGGGMPPYTPGRALTTFHDHSLGLGTHSLLQLPAAGYVAADGNGAVAVGDAAPSARWKQVIFDKPGSPGSLTTAPDPNDAAVYVDEEIHFLLDKYGNAAGTTGIKGYELDNEPGLWHHYQDGGNEGTHSRLHPALTTCGEMLERNTALAKTIRRMDPTAEIFGPAMWGYPEFYSLWTIYDAATQTMHQPSDWATYNVEPYTTNNTGDAYRYNHMTWVNAYLAGMKNASDAAGMRLLDAFSVHYYSAAAGTDAARVQAPRSLWDPTFTESSWITQAGNGFTDGRPLLLLPKLRQSINDFYPGTKLAITEYSFGGRHHVSGGIAQADALGIFGREGVDLANYFFTVDDYIAAAFKIYRNYDGANGTFGDTSVSCTTSDLANSASYASLDNQGRLHIIIINRNPTRQAEVTVQITSPENWQHAEYYMFGPANSQIQRMGDEPINGRTLSVTLQPSTVHHFVLMLMTSSGVATGTESNDDIMISAEPNPITGMAHMQVRYPGAGQTTLKLYDMLGNEVATLVEGYRERGKETITLDGNEFPAGSYTAVLTCGGMRSSINVRIIR